MITFEPLFDVIAKRRKGPYSLIKDKVIGGGTMQRIRENKSISTDTLNDLCQYLRCKPQDIIRYTPDVSE